MASGSIVREQVRNRRHPVSGTGKKRTQPSANTFTQAMKWEWCPDEGYGWWLYVRLGKLWLTVGGYQGNWYFQLMWA
jgi:hypothetical protein